jgi:hypothetical protein
MVDERRPLVIVSAGGAPRDINLIQSHKAMEHASQVLAEGGTMIALAECAQGLGRDDFLRWFAPGGARATALMLADDYKINGQTAWSLRRKTDRCRPDHGTRTASHARVGAFGRSISARLHYSRWSNDAPIFVHRLHRFMK